MKRVPIPLLLAGLFLSAWGCQGKPAMKPLNLEIAPDAKSLSETSGAMPTVIVDLVGAQDGDELKRFEQKPVDAWIQPSDDLRIGSIVKTMTFRPGAYSPQVLPSNDPIWSQWKAHRAMHLVIFANFPVSLKPGEGDPRKFILPLNSQQWDNVRWDRGNTVRVEIRRSGMTPFPPPQPPK